jgi:hypothetical protein
MEENGTKVEHHLDKFHETLTKIVGKKMVIAITMGIILFFSWYVISAYKEYDVWIAPEGGHEDWQIIREIKIVDGVVTEFNYSIAMNMGFMMKSADWENMVFVTNYTDENGIHNYREVAILVEADFSQLAHFEVFLGRTLSVTPVKYKLTISYYLTLTLMPQFHLSEGMIYDPIKHRAVEEIEDLDLVRLHEIALIRFANIYYELKRSQTLASQVVWWEGP